MRILFQGVAPDRFFIAINEALFPSQNGKGGGQSSCQHVAYLYGRTALDDGAYQCNDGRQGEVLPVICNKGKFLKIDFEKAQHGKKQKHEIGEAEKPWTPP